MPGRLEDLGPLPGPSLMEPQVADTCHNDGDPNESVFHITEFEWLIVAFIRSGICAVNCNVALISLIAAEINQPLPDAKNLVIFSSFACLKEKKFFFFFLKILSISQHQSVTKNEPTLKLVSLHHFKNGSYNCRVIASRIWEGLDWAFICWSGDSLLCILRV